MSWNLQNYGERGVLLNGLDEATRAALIRHAADHPPDGLAEYVPGYANLLLLFNTPVPRKVLRRWLDRLDTGEGASPVDRGARHSIRVIYDGPDLEAVARKIEATPKEVVDLHSRAVYTVRMSGFAPGFPYLDGLDARLQVPRRATPRTRIAPGSVAIGGPHAGIYSVASPGGWHLLGRTDVRLFVPEAAGGRQPIVREVFPVQPGDRVEFQPVRRFDHG